MERNNDFACTGWMPNRLPSPATRGQLIGLRDKLLAEGYKESAMAVDNAIDVIENEKIARAVAAYNDDAANYDFTPFPKEMPDIDFKKIDEIPF